MHWLVICTIVIAQIDYSYSIANSSLEEPRIVQGHSVEIHTIPYQAQIIWKQKFICGATIISEYWILSAAHCFERFKNVAVLTGSKNISKGEIHAVKKIFTHEHYNVSSFDNDISLLQLRVPIIFNVNQKAIAISSRVPRLEDQIIISGFGMENENDRNTSSVLKMAYVPIVDHKTCSERYFPDIITSNMFCAGVGITDSCYGDSGGPAVINNKLVGIVSWGKDCASKYHPGVYTKVYRYRHWISKVTGMKLQLIFTSLV